MWRGLGNFSERKGGAFCIYNVTGPDEYTAVVDNNCFTNMMARQNLRLAARTVNLIRLFHPEDYKQLVSSARDCTRRSCASGARQRPHVPAGGRRRPASTRRTTPSSTNRVWDCAAHRAENYPLLLHYHPLTLYRHQVLKQADVVMAMFLLGQDFCVEEKSRNFDYYDPLTTRDSSLSSCVQSIVATEVGYEDRAMEYFADAVLVDLADLGGNVTDGVHIASIGGVWMALVYGFGGMRDYDGDLDFHPRLPAAWKRLRFPLTWRDRRIEVELLPEEVTYRLVDGPAMTLRHEGKPIELAPDAPVVRCRCARGAFR